MGEKAFAVMTLMGLISSFCFGLVVTCWTILSAVTDRVDRPTKPRLKASFQWTVISWFVTGLLVCFTLMTPVSVMFFLLSIPAALLSASAGALYRP